MNSYFTFAILVFTDANIYIIFQLMKELIEYFESIFHFIT
ncbi:hypothetical protein HMPREF1981_03230 [Bacteroides pyogenes F0041]|uniref:Uncharacterized protein n=1 Tax=Bacteroides pyogenes F0041 TaxID=1321819 RepID=U2DP27_9BACE|nr:hypothetical protein HMPREF1981_03230 [Bacteroides pyogenes F0041]